MSMFDTYVMVDWSAGRPAKSDRPKANAIWWAVQRALRARTWADLHWSNRINSLVAFERTRSSAIRHVLAFLKNEVEAKRRVLIGLDFAFGYPKGFADAVSKQLSVRTIADFLKREFRISGRDYSDHDDKAASEHRFAVARSLNKTLAKTLKPGVNGPFWSVNEDEVHQKGDPHKQEWPFEFNRLRATDEHAPGAQLVWKVSGPGSVGSQALLGLPWLEVLRGELREMFGTNKSRCVVWPCDAVTIPEQKDGPRVVIVEIYPSLITKGRCDTIPDRAQVVENARAFMTLDARGQLAPLFDLKSLRKGDGTPIDAVTAEVEGWILGVGRDDIVQSVVKSDSPLYRASASNTLDGKPRHESTTSK